MCEKFGQSIAQCSHDDELRRWDSWSDGGEPGAEPGPDEVRDGDSKTLENALSDEADQIGRASCRERVYVLV